MGNLSLIQLDSQQDKQHSNCCEHRSLFKHFSIRFQNHWFLDQIFQGLPGIGRSSVLKPWQDGNGYIDRTEIGEVMKALGEELDDETWPS